MVSSNYHKVDADVQSEVIGRAAASVYSSEIVGTKADGITRDPISRGTTTCSSHECIEIDRLSKNLPL